MPKIYLLKKKSNITVVDHWIELKVIRLHEICKNPCIFFQQYWLLRTKGQNDQLPNPSQGGNI